MNEKKIGFMMASLAILMASVAQGNIQLDGGTSVYGEMASANGTRDIADSYTLTDSSTGAAVPLDTGKPFNMEFKFRTVAVAPTADGDKIGYNSPEIDGWALSDSLKLGFSDGVQALALQFDLKDFQPKVEFGGDDDATSASNFKLDGNLDKSGELTSSGLTNADKLKFVGDTASFNLTVDRTATNTFDMTLIWGDYTANYTYTSTADMTEISDFYVRINDLDVNLGYNIMITPDDPTSTNAPAGNVDLSADWDFEVATSNMAVLSESSDGFYVEMTNSLSINAKRFMYQMDENAFSVPFQVGETATWSFTAGAGSNFGFESGDEFFQGGLWDSGVLDDNGIAFKVDWGAGTDPVILLGKCSVSDPTDIGVIAGGVQSVGSPSTVIGAAGDTADFVISMERTSLTNVQAIMSYDDLSVTNDLTLSPHINSLDELGFRFKQSGDNALVISNMELVISNLEFAGYAKWATDQGLTAGVNDDPNDDPDGDNMENLLEYALGGNPLVKDDATYLPTVSQEGDYLNLVYRRKLNADSIGLNYNVFSSTDLVNEPVTNTTVEVGSAVLDADFEVVTNQVSTAVEVKQFMQLEVSED